MNRLWRSGLLVVIVLVGGGAGDGPAVGPTPFGVSGSWAVGPSPIAAQLLEGPQRRARSC